MRRLEDCQSSGCRTPQPSHYPSPPCYAEDGDSRDLVEESLEGLEDAVDYPFLKTPRKGDLVLDMGHVAKVLSVHESGDLRVQNVEANEKWIAAPFKCITLR